MTRARVDGSASAAEHHALWEELDALAACFGVELRLEHDTTAPMPWAVWCWSPDQKTEQNADIIGAGAAGAEAIGEARGRLLAWEQKA